MGVVLIWRLYETPSELAGRYVVDRKNKYGPIGGVEASIIPDEPDVPDANDALQGFGEYGLASGSSSASGCLVLSGRRAG